MMDDSALTPGMAKIIKEGFCHFDKNGDQTISKSELGSVLRAIGQNPTERNIEEYMQRADADGTGSLSYDEFVSLVDGELLDEDELKVEMRQAFQYFDKDKNGLLDVKELYNILTSIGDCLSLEEAEHFLRLADANGDGKLNVDEFTKAICQQM